MLACIHNMKNEHYIKESKVRKMNCKDLLEDGNIFEAREQMLLDIKNGKHDVDTHEIINKEYTDLKNCQSRIATETPWKFHRKNKNAADTDDKIEIYTSNMKVFPNDYMLKIKIFDVADLPFEILKHLNMCNTWIGCILQSTLVEKISKNICILKLKVVHHVLSMIGIAPPRYVFVKVTVFDNTRVDNSCGVMIKHLSAKNCKSFFSEENYLKNVHEIKRLNANHGGNTYGMFDTVVVFFHDMQNRKQSIESFQVTLEKLKELECTIFIQNMTVSTYLPGSLQTNIVSDFLYSSCIWWTAHSKMMLRECSELSAIRCAIVKNKLEEESILQASLEQKRLEEELILQNIIAKTISVNLIEF